MATYRWHSPCCWEASFTPPAGSSGIGFMQRVAFCLAFRSPSIFSCFGARAVAAPQSPSSYGEKSSMTFCFTEAQAILYSFANPPPVCLPFLFVTTGGIWQGCRSAGSGTKHFPDARYTTKRQIPAKLFRDS